MAYELAKVKKWEGRGGTGYTAELRKDGQQVALIRDDGNGGCVHIDFLIMEKGKAPRRNSEAEKALYEHVGTLPPHTWHDGTTSTMDVEIFIGTLFDQYLEDQSYKRRCAKKTLFRLKSNKPGEYMMIDRVFTPELKAALENKHGENLAEIINERFSR